MKILGQESGASPRRADMFRIAARVQYRSPWLSDDILWIDVPQDLAHQASRTGSPWLAALLPLAMVLHEDIALDQEVDGELLTNAGRLMATWARWYPELHPIEVQAKVAEPPTASSGQMTGAFFSGGVGFVLHRTLRPSRSGRQHR